MIATREPDITGKIGRAWDITKVAADPQTNAMISAYVCEYDAPDGNQMSYFIGLVHLRLVPGQHPPVKHSDSAAYEFAIYLINPNTEADVDKADSGDFSGVQVLADPTVIHQFHGVTGQDLRDKDAREIIVEVITQLLNPPKNPRERLNPEKDYGENFVRVIQAGIDKRFKVLGAGEKPLLSDNVKLRASV